MTKQTIDSILQDLGQHLNKIANTAALDPNELVTAMPKRGLTGDHIAGGKVINFASTGIKDRASDLVLEIRDDGILAQRATIPELQGDVLAQGNFTVAGTLKADVLEVGEIKADLKLEKTSPLEFKAVKGDSPYGKGLLWTGYGITKQFVMSGNPDRLFSTEHIDIAQDKSYSIGGIGVLSTNTLGPSIINSSLKTLGRLRELKVDGDIEISEYVFFDSITNRLGLGIDTPNSALSVAEDGVEVMLGTKDSSQGMVGTFAGQAFDIVTDNTARISIAANGNILLGNTKLPPVQVNVHGKVAIRVNVPDPEVDLQVAGPIKFHGHRHEYGNNSPTSGDYDRGDIVWNNHPFVGSYVGWVCTQSGSPGTWSPFGAIVNL